MNSIHLCCFVISVILIHTFGLSVEVNKNNNDAVPRIAVLGAGVSGLAVARHLKGTGVNLTVFEQTPCPGGTWRYDTKVGVDEYGDPILTSMYRDLRTNLPAAVMQYPGYPLPEGTPEFPTDEEIYQYLFNFMVDFDLQKYIKFNHKVTRIDRLSDTWLVKYVDRDTNDVCEEVFDYVIVGTGHTSKPNMPDKFPGEDTFKGKIIHSHDYRIPEVYQDKSVMIVGMGPSAVDIAVEILPYAKKMYLSHRGEFTVKSAFPSHLEKKPAIKAYNESGVFFADGTYGDVDDVIYGTGYVYDYPFMTEGCGIITYPKYVIPLYKLIVNINQPTMFFIGSVNQASNLICSDAQARYVASLICGNFTLPSRGAMMTQWMKQVNGILSKGQSLANLHLALGSEDAYYKNLASEAGIAPVPTVLANIRTENVKARSNLDTYRKYRYIIVDDEHFVRQLVENGTVISTERF